MGNHKQINKVVILGSRGMLGYALSKYFYAKGYVVTSLDRNDFDVLADPLDKLTQYLTGADFVVNCIGIIKPRISTMKVEDVMLVNSLFPKNLAKFTKQMQVPCFHITTDCVYSGERGHYNEDDYFDITDLYGLSKNAGENAECMTIRTSIIGEEINNNYSLLEWAKSQSGKTVTGFNNHLWNGVTTLYLAEIIEQIYLKNKYTHGIFHFFSPKSVTKYELLKLINNSYKLSLQIIKADATSKVDRTMSSRFSFSAEFVTKTLSQQISEMHDFFFAHK